MEKDVKLEITERWVKAVDYLIEKGLVKSYVDLEMQTGILNQRVADYKRYAKGTGRPSYVSIDQVYLLHNHFNVCLDYVISGKMPILAAEKTPAPNVANEGIGIPLFQTYINSIENAGKIQALETKVKALEEMLSEILKKGMI